MEHRNLDSPSRREFLKGASAAGAGLVAGTVAAVPAAHASVVSSDVAAVSPGGYLRVNGAPPSRIDFGRIFPDLPPFADATDTVRAALMEVGQPGGILDARDELAAGPKALIVDPTVNGNPTDLEPLRDQPGQPDDDGGLDVRGAVHRSRHHVRSDLAARGPAEPAASPNTRTPALDLDSVFGGGPGLRPDLYVENPDGSVGPKLKIGTGGVHEDVPRVANGDGTYTALLGDPRNDENVIIAGLHCAHILFYNRVLDELAEHRPRATSRPPGTPTGPTATCSS